VLLLPLSRYAEVRRHDGRFIHAPGHPIPVGHIVEEGEGFEVVEKDE
jgi:hypothetical protein